MFLTLRTLVCAPAPARVVLSGETMGTTWSVVLNAPGLAREDRTRARLAVQSALDDVNDAMSTWDPESELSRFNAHVSTEPFELSAATLEVLALAEQVSRASDGAFDVTVRPLVAAWGFGSGARLPGDGPSPDEIASLRERTGFDRLAIDRGAGNARKAHPELEIDLSAIAKGYGVDRAAQALRALGQHDFLVEVGGEVRANGRRAAGGAWRVAIERPTPDGRAIHGVVSLADQAMASSGDYRSFYETEEGWVAHIIDPRTGRPIGHGVASVSVVHSSTATADAWATALTVLGFEAGRTLAAERGLGVYWILREPSGALRFEATDAFPAVERRIDAEG